jgi:predicted restriction endonuclease
MGHIAQMDYWGGRCPLTGITDRALLRASRILPWLECDTDAQRLDVHNGLLLSALWDAAFDAGLISFTDDGMVLTPSSLSPVADGILSRSRMTAATIALTAVHQMNIRRHRSSHGFSVEQVGI